MAYNREKIKKNYNLFVKQYARKSKGMNDRRYDRKLEKIIKNMKAEQLYAIISNNDDDNPIL